MKKVELAILAACFIGLSYEAKAVDLEVGVARTQYETLLNGIWYQEGFPYYLDLDTLGWSVGVSGKPSGWPRLRAEYLDLGMARADALAVGDPNYNPTQPNYCNGPCEIPARYVSKGKVRGIALTMAPEFAFGGGAFYVEGGLFVYKATYEIFVSDAYQDIYGVGNGKTLYAKHDAKIDKSMTFGAGFRYRNVSVGWR